MTIETADWNRYHEATEDFHYQAEPDSCFPTALKNIFDELADRIGEPSIRHNISDIADALDYENNRASATDRLSSRLDPLLEDGRYEVNAMTGMGYEQLNTIIDDDQRSLPICELHMQYFEDIGQYTERYTPEPGLDGYGRWPHVVIPFKFNDETVLFFDPYIQFFHDLDDIDESGALNVPLRAFNEWWTRPEKRWTLWAEPMEQLPMQQQTLDEAFGNE